MIQATDHRTEAAPTLSAPRPIRSLSLCRSIRIKADPRRILNALTLAEYMETWFSAPQPVELRQCSGSALSSIQLQLHAPLSRGIRISLRNIEAAEDHLTCRWIKTAHGCHMESALDIRIERFANSCSLTLRHQGFSSTRECHWHSTLWTQSLTNLRQLMEPIAAPRRL